MTRLFRRRTPAVSLIKKYGRGGPTFLLVRDRRGQWKKIIRNWE